RSANGLVPVKVATWEKFVLVNLDSNAEPVERFLGRIMQRMAPLEVTKLHYVASRQYDIACNWKVYVDNYLDGGYHVPHLHKGLNSVLDYKEYTIENSEHYCLQSSPMVSSNEHAEFAATRTGNRAHYYWLYPNFMVNIYDGVMDTNLVLPLATDRCLVQ